MSRRRPSRSTCRVVVSLIVLLVSIGAARAQACDVCAIYTATEQRESRAGFRIGVAEQFTRFATMQDDGHKIDNPGEHLNSSITQLILGYDVHSRFGVQLTIPLIERTFRRQEEGVIRPGSESGLGDVSLIGIARPFNYVTEQSVLRTSLFGGLKFPTGSSHRLREELHESEDGPIGVHGHDIALGSGSFDGVIGGAFFASWKRFFWTTGAQYAMRTTGSIDYRYANEVTWSGGPGAFPLLTHEMSLSVQALVTGEHKGTDSLAGEEAEDTGMTAVYMGPNLAFTWGTSLAADLGVEFPIMQDNTSVQLVPDYRIRAGVGWRF